MSPCVCLRAAAATSSCLHISIWSRRMMLLLKRQCVDDWYQQVQHTCTLTHTPVYYSWEDLNWLTTRTRFSSITQAPLQRAVCVRVLTAVVDCRRNICPCFETLHLRFSKWFWCRALFEVRFQCLLTSCNMCKLNTIACISNIFLLVMPAVCAVCN